MGSTKGLNALAILFIVSGTILTLENVGLITGVSALWPFLVIITGSGFLMLFFEHGRNDLSMIWMGTFLVLVGLFFQYLSFSSWRHIVRLWPFFLGIIGFSFLTVSLMSTVRLFRYLAVLFLALFLALTIVFTVSLVLWPVSLIIFGFSLLSIGHFDTDTTKPEK
ncbi:MAG: hypothetical protein GF344_10320 [Chitinivibrionales bacterium]|nr:hypothetical protein [Chitinivibrionales bacterium]MBD3357223.1 hypothetical protein [Chitinivibrionales bacterium]